MGVSMDMIFGMFLKICEASKTYNFTIFLKTKQKL